MRKSSGFVAGGFVSRPGKNLAIDSLLAYPFCTFGRHSQVQALLSSSCMAQERVACLLPLSAFTREQGNATFRAGLLVTAVKRRNVF